MIVDRLSKGVILIPLKNLRAETVAKKFIKYFVPRHGFPSGIVSDRGTQFVGEIWSFVCRSMKTERRLSTAFHPQTDGQTERMNAVIEDYLRKHCDYYQTNWKDLLSAAELSINNRDSSATGVSPFFHELTTRRNERRIAKNIVDKLASALDMAQTELAAAQQRMEDAVNRHRDPAHVYKPGDKVWLDRLDVEGIHNVFHTSLLRPASKDPFPSQEASDYQPPGILIDGELEYLVESIDDERTRKRGRGFSHEYLVKWVGYDVRQWIPAKNLEDTEALDKWEAVRASAPRAQKIIPTRDWPITSPPRNGRTQL